MTLRRQRLVDPQDSWLAGLRAVLRKIADEGCRLVIGEGTAGAEFVRHFALRLNIPCEVIHELPNAADPTAQPAGQDRAVLAAVGTVYVLGIRTEGNIHRLLRHHLQSRIEQDAQSADGVNVLSHRQNVSSAQVIFIDLPGLQSKIAREELCESGAHLWQPTQKQCRPLQSSDSYENEDGQERTAAGADCLEIVPFPQSEAWEFLSHTTRACPGPWPAESFESYCDSLLECRPDADHSPLGALRRILDQRLLRASNRTIRDGYQIVSLTACPLLQLPALHQFRPHRVRWDFEPYGLCIRRNWLMNRGARPVIYGDEAAWQSLPVADRAFFQLATGKSGIDWSLEREWRYPGSLELNHLSSDDVLVFVPNFQAAKSIAQVTNWPITLWPADERPRASRSAESR